MNLVDWLFAMENRTFLAFSFLLFVSPAFAQPAPDAAFSSARLAQVRHYIDRFRLFSALL